MAGKPWLSPSPRSVLTSRLDQAQIPMLGGRRRRISTRFETRPLFELISQRYERGSTMITSNLPFEEWTETFGTERLTGALLDRLTHHVNILEMNGESYRLSQSRSRMDPRNK